MGAFICGQIIGAQTARKLVSNSRIDILSEYKQGYVTYFTISALSEDIEAGPTLVINFVKSSLKFYVPNITRPYIRFWARKETLLFPEMFTTQPPTLFQSSNSSQTLQECGICYDDYSSVSTHPICLTICCNHPVCLECVNKYISETKIDPTNISTTQQSSRRRKIIKTCPFCRSGGKNFKFFLRRDECDASNSTSILSPRPESIITSFLATTTHDNYNQLAVYGSTNRPKPIEEISIAEIEMPTLDQLYDKQLIIYNTPLSFTEINCSQFLQLYNIYNIDIIVTRYEK